MLDQILVIVSVTFLVMVSPGPDMVLVLRNTPHSTAWRILGAGHILML